MEIKERVAQAVAELSAMQQVLNEAELQELAEKIMAARKVVFTAQGRSGFSARSIVCRLMHIGIDVHMAGQPDTPAIGEGDLLIAISSSAKTQITLNHLATAKKVGAASVLITAQTKELDVSDAVLRLPAKTAVPSDQHAGSLFEQSVLVVGDAVCWYVQQKLNVPEEVLNRRHSNLQ